MSRKFFCFVVLLFLTVFLIGKESDDGEKKKNDGWFGEPRYALIEAGIGFFYHNFYFETKDGELGTEGHVKYVDDLDFKPTYVHLNADLILRFKKFKLSLGYTALNDKTTKTLEKDITFFDAIFSQNDTVDSIYNMHLLTLDFTWYILDLNLGENLNFKLGPSIRIDAYLTDVKMEDTNSDKGDKFVTPIVPFPSIGLSFETTVFKYGGAFIDLNGVYGGKKFGYMNFKSGIRIYPWHWTGIEIAYRHLLAKAIWKDDLVKSQFHGLNTSFFLRF